MFWLTLRGVGHSCLFKEALLRIVSVLFLLLDFIAVVSGILEDILSVGNDVLLLFLALLFFALDGHHLLHFLDWVVFREGAGKVLEGGVSLWLKMDVR